MPIYDLLKINDKYLHRMTWYTGMYGITAMGLLLYGLDPMVTDIYFYD
jgi:hypothetical protein